LRKYLAIPILPFLLCEGDKTKRSIKIPPCHPRWRGNLKY
jgi:hypothetical protein